VSKSVTQVMRVVVLSFRVSDVGVVMLLGDWSV